MSDYYSKRTGAQYLVVHTDTVYDMASHHEIPHSKGC